MHDIKEMEILKIPILHHPDNYFEKRERKRKREREKEKRK